MKKDVYDYVSLKHMSMWRFIGIPYSFILLILSFVGSISFVYLKIAIPEFHSNQVNAMFAVFIGVSLLNLTNIVLSLNKARNMSHNYNFLIEHGVIFTGKILYATMRNGYAIVEASIYDKDNDIQYFYKTIAPGIWLLKGMRLAYYGKNYPDIPIIVDPNNKENGFVLIQEYYDDMKKKYGDVMYAKENLFDNDKWYR